MMQEIELSEFRWRPKQRRLVKDAGVLRHYDEFKVLGKSMNVIFKLHSFGIDPHTKNRKQAKIYLPCKETTPVDKQDIVLCLHI